MVQNLCKKFSVDGVKPVLGAGEWGETKQRRNMPLPIANDMRMGLLRS